MTEDWKWIKGCEGKYQISNHGRLKSFLKNQNGEIRSNINKKGWYITVNLIDNSGKRNTLRIHRLVYENFAGEIPKGYHIHHKDGNKQNNMITNLEALSPKEHCFETIKHNPHILDGLIAYNKGTPIGDKTIYKRFPRGQIFQYTLNGEFIAKYPNAMDASRESGVCARNILQVASKEPFNKKGNIRKQAGGYIWRFEKEVV